MNSENNFEELKKNTMSGLLWRFGERITAQLISFFVSIILARILMPEEYGIIAMVNIFITIANVFVSSGLGTSLVQKKDADDLDFSTMFYANAFISIILYGIVFILAPYIAVIFKNELLIPIIRVMGIRIPIASINSIQHAFVSQKMIYKKFFWSTLFGTIISAIVGIYLAFKGFGVWALVWQYLTNSTIDTIVLFITLKWKPKLLFSFKRFKSLFSYGWKITCASLIGTIFDQLRSFIIGAKYTAADLAYNNKGEQFPNLISNNINSTLESVLFSSISKLQDNKQKVKKAMSRLMKTSSFIIIPILLGLASVAETLVKIILTEKWLPCVPFLRVICIQQCFTILNSANLQAIKAVGRSDILLKLEFIKKPLYFAMLLITMQISPFAICAGNAFYAIFALFINSYPNKKILDYSIVEQWKDIYYYLIISIVMSMAVYLIGFVKLNVYLLLFIQTISGIVIYISISKYLKLDSLNYVLDLLKNLEQKRGI